MDNTFAPLIIERHLTITATDSALDSLSNATGLSKQRLKQAMQKGCLWLQRGQQVQRLRRVSKPVQSGDVLHLYYDEQILATIPPCPTLIADEGNYSIWNKPCGLYSQGTKWGDHCTITRSAEQFLTPQRPAFTVHRLDRAANGLIIVAHKKTVAAAFAKLFEQRQLHKYYRATVNGQWLDDGELELNTPVENKPARSYVKRLSYDAVLNQSVLQVRIESGRKHQIRRHLAGAGFPIVGDRLYGQDESQDLQLTSYYLAFTCPVTQRERVYHL